MANTQDKPSAEELASEKPPKADSDEFSTTVEDYITRGRAFFDVHPADVAGAFAGVDANKKVALPTAKTRVDKWLKSEEQKD